MNQGFNPYSPPTGGADNFGQMPATDPTGAITPAVMESLSGTRPWVIFLAILGFILAGLMVLGGLGIMVAGGLSDQLPGALGLVYIFLALFYLFPSLFLIRYGSAIGTLTSGGGVPALEQALAHQRSFWRLVGIMTALLMGLYALIIVIVVVVSIAG